MKILNNSIAISIVDMLLMPFVYPSAILLKVVRKLMAYRVPRCKHALINVGMFPIVNHYYEPQFDYRNTMLKFSQERKLPGIDWNASEQLEILQSFIFSKEFEYFLINNKDSFDFCFDSQQFFGEGDAEYWYQIIRYIKPRMIVEVGSGHSTLMAMKAIRKNIDDSPSYNCDHICIEPYEMPWLEKLDIMVIRKKVEEMDVSFFQQLQKNDILFIDSSHIIRPCGDLIYEYLELLPSLNKGVIVHIHDIFSPRNYPKSWVIDEVRFWNEQYLLEAFLSHNNSWKIIGALNYLHHNHYERLKKCAPYLSPDKEPGSFYIQKIY